MITRTRSLFTGPSTSTEELRKKIASQDKLNATHLDQLGRYSPEADMVSNVWFGITAELAREAARAEVEQEGCSNKNVKEFIEQSREFDRRFAKRKLDKDVEMGISSAARELNLLILLRLLPSPTTLRPPPQGQAPMYHSTPLVARAAVRG